MGKVRIRWRSAAKAAAILAVAVLALQALPGLLKPPQAPPLAPDVGLPRVPAEQASPATAPREPAAALQKSRRPRAVPTVAAAPVAPEPTLEPAPPSLPAPEPAPSPAPIPPPAPPAPPPPPSDGSLEFAPH